MSEGCPTLEEYDNDEEEGDRRDDEGGLDGDYPPPDYPPYPSMDDEEELVSLSNLSNLSSRPEDFLASVMVGVGGGVGVGVDASRAELGVDTGRMGVTEYTPGDDTGVTTTTTSSATPTPIYSRAPSVRISVSLGENLGGGGGDLPSTTPTTLTDQEYTSTPHPTPSPQLSTPSTPLALVSLAPGLALAPMTPLPPAPKQQLPQPALTAQPASAAQMALAQVFDEIALQLTLQVERAVLEVCSNPNPNPVILTYRCNLSTYY